uniref:Fibrinogen C-terminal domain-containing protein n=1 Tax=Glossina pallidipes TaxID=7398 RepID=A0A1A9Z6H7_GLOPL
MTSFSPVKQICSFLRNQPFKLVKLLIVVAADDVVDDDDDDVDDDNYCPTKLHVKEIVATQRIAFCYMAAPTYCILLNGNTNVLHSVKWQHQRIISSSFLTMSKHLATNATIILNILPKRFHDYGMNLSGLFMLIIIEGFHRSLYSNGNRVESKDLNDKLENLNQLLNKLHLSVRKLDENSQRWPIWQHHVESWNDGLRVIENKLDLLKRLEDEQQSQLQKIEIIIIAGIDRKSQANPQTDALHRSLLSDIKNLFNRECKERNQLSHKLNNIMLHLQTVDRDDEVIKLNTKKKNLNRVDKVMLPSSSSSSSSSTGGVDCNNQSILNFQKLKQLHSLAKRNSKSLDNIMHSLADNVHRQEEILSVLHRSNNCCYAITNELTTFTESSDVLLKRIEKLLHNVDDKFHSFDDDETKNDENSKEGEDEQDEEEFLSAEASTDSGSGEENSGEPLFIDGIYKFASLELNEAKRDFNERYCIYPYENRTGWPWTLIQHRGPYEKQENFNRSWSDYRNGFGSLARDFWFGNEFIHRLVYENDYELRIELEDFNGTQTWAEYGVFRVDSEKYNYNLLIGDYRGIAPDAMRYHNEMDFSTYDRRNDNTKIDACCPCALSYASGWWFDSCAETNLNGIYHRTPLHHNYIGGYKNYNTNSINNNYEEENRH